MSLNRYTCHANKQATGVSSSCSWNTALNSLKEGALAYHVQVNYYFYGYLLPMPVEIQICINNAGLSRKAWLLGSHCHDSEGTSEAQRGESLIIVAIHFSSSLKMNLFFFLYRWQDHQLSRKKSAEKHKCEASLCLPVDTQRFSDAS